ncbi:MAG TPA: bifunctional phosphopantothenoylcysteine decarboxylase/phosphopantothenate--cysteine ligase CoaBC [Gammaproteobacteria bacterium]|nr:bifunctional phosphopantothenoylcysteine decarboxylase/phosphopantothenate--cysteine ligase CoaBC [Gammaproteobacteria bacterium]
MSAASTIPRKILLGVTGGIAAYKSPDLVRKLVARGCEVQVVLSGGARHFVTPLTFQAVSGRRVREDLWDEEAEAAMGHIELARWADAVLVAPATAHFLGALAAGLAGDLLTTLCIATAAPVIAAPAMNRQMWAHAAVQANCKLLESRGVRLLGPAAGEQACGEHGLGRMLEPEQIADALLTPSADGAGPLGKLKAVITAGPTREPIDPVRYITNRSSGRMGFAIAAAARAAGADVVLVSGPVALETPAGVRRVDVETAEQMFRSVHAEIAGADLFIACAAVADYRPHEAALEKIKRTEPDMHLELIRSPDTLASVAALPNPPFTVGFAAETHNVAQYAREKLDRKRVDMIAANRVGPDCGFDRDTNELTVYWPGGELRLGEGSKAALARRLVELIAERFAAARSKSAGRETAAPAQAGGESAGARA